MFFLGIDIGSTFLKCGIISTEDHSISHVRSIPSPARKAADDPHFFEYDAVRYADLVYALVREAVSVCKSDIGVILSTQMHGFVIDNTYISWQDSRCLEWMEENISYLDYMKSLVSVEMMRPCGVYFKPALGVCNLFAKLHKEKRLGQAAEIYTLGSYVIHAMTGNNFCHITNAAPFGFADIENRSWLRALFEKFQLSHLRLPQIMKEDYSPCGNCTINGKDVTFYPDYGDQQVSVLGSGADHTAAIINIATASQLITFSRSFISGEYEVRPYFDHTYIRVLSNMPGGRGLSVIAAFIKDVGRRIYHVNMDDGAIYAYMGSLSSFDTRHLAVDMSFYPTYDKFDGGSIFNITSNNLTVDTLFAAMYEAMAKEYKRGLECLMPEEGVDNVICIGGAAQKNGALRAVIENVLGRPCILPKSADEVLLGLLGVAERIDSVDSRVYM